MTTRYTKVALALLAVGVAGCGVPLQKSPTRLEHAGVRVATAAPPTSLPPGTPTRRVDLYLVSGDRLVKREVRLRTPLSVRDTLAALVGASETDLQAGVRSAINDLDLATAGATTRGVAQVDLNAEFLQIAPADQVFALAQIVCTLTSLPGVGQVQFTQDGSPIDVPRADSSLTNQPVSRYDYQRLLPSA